MPAFWSWPRRATSAAPRMSAPPTPPRTTSKTLWEWLPLLLTTSWQSSGEPEGGALGHGDTAALSAKAGQQQDAAAAAWLVLCLTASPHLACPAQQLGGEVGPTPQPHPPGCPGCGACACLRRLGVHCPACTASSSHASQWVRCRRHSHAAALLTPHTRRRRQHSVHLHPRA